jgi:alpha-galactosidase
MHEWLKQNLLSAVGEQPFSFIFDGQPSKGLLVTWNRKTTTTKLDDQRTGHVLTWTDPQSGLDVRCAAVEYAHFPVVEWTVHLRNAGTADTPVLSDIQGLDVQFPGIDQGGRPVVLHHHKGDTCGWDAYAPLEDILDPGSSCRFAPAGGRPTSLAFPYFNLQSGDQGRIVVLGWPGQWQASFIRNDQGVVRVQGGQEQVCCRLQPGEEIRTPLAVLMFWKGDRICAQNLWRRWMLTHNLPRCGGKLHPPFSSQCQGLRQNEQGEKAYIDALVRHDARVDYWWMDAGWWKEGFPVEGNWVPDKGRFPNGIRPVAEHAHANGMKLVLWFEPERVSPGTPWASLDKWLLAIPPEAHRVRRCLSFNSPKFMIDEAERNQFVAGDRLLNLGDPEALKFLTEFLSARIVEWEIDFLRIDFNFAPLAFWRAADQSDRQGLTENRYVSGWLALLDELRRRHPDLWIDTCASGGRRIDLETLRRALPLLRSDYQFEPIGNQSHTLGLAAWIPFFGTGVRYADPYVARSSFAPSFGLGYAADKGKPDWALFRRQLIEWKQVAPCFMGDFYPLTQHTLNDDAWLAWQFDRPDLHEGMVQVFRRAQSSLEKARFKLRGLDATATYNVKDFDREGSVKISGRELMEKGLPVTLEPRQAAIFRYLTSAFE